jgi:acyl carrier protein
MKEAIKKIIIEILEENGEKVTTEITEATNLRDLGLTSFDLALLTTKIEDGYDVDIFEDGIIFTFGEILKKINQ